MENLNIKYAIDFINKMGYRWDGEILNNEKPSTIYNFFCPQTVKLNGEVKGLILYDEQDDSPECIIYKIVKGIFIIEKNLTDEWVKYLNNV